MPKDTTIILAVLVIAVVIVTPSILSGGSQLLNRLDDWIKYGFPTGDNGDTDDLFGGNGQAGINLRVFYTDGTMKELSILPMQFYPLSIPVDGDGTVTLDRIEADLSATLQYDGNMQNYECDWTFNVALKTSGGTTIQDFGTWTHGTSGDWASGSQLIFRASSNPMFTKQTIYANQIETALQGRSTGYYRVDFNLKLDLTMTFEEGNTDSKSAETTSYYSFQWELAQGKITSLSISVDAVGLN